jgi:hypothetical protein
MTEGPGSAGRVRGRLGIVEQAVEQLGQVTGISGRRPGPLERGDGDEESAEGDRHGG